MKIHYIAEWATHRGMERADIIRELGVDKSNVSRWFTGRALPSADYLRRLAALFHLDDVNALFRHPDDDWMTQFFRERDDEERKRIKQALELMFPPRRTGTEG